MSYLTPEKRVQNSIIDYLDKLKESGIALEYFRRDATGRNYKKGLPDLWMVVNGWHIEIEVKAPGGKRRADQERWERRFMAAGTPYAVIISLEEFIKFITPYLPVA